MTALHEVDYAIARSRLHLVREELSSDTLCGRPCDPGRIDGDKAVLPWPGNRAEAEYCRRCLRAGRQLQARERGDCR